MALEERKGIWYWRKTINGVAFGKSTKTGDKREAEKIAAIWEAEAVREVVLKGTKPVNLHAVIRSFLAARQGTGGHANAVVHTKHFLAIPDKRFGDVTLDEAQTVIEKRRAAGTSHNTLAVTVSYWNALCNYAAEQKWGAGPKLPAIKPEKTRLRYLSREEEAALFAAIDPKASYPGKCPRTDKARQDNTDLLIGLLDTGARYNEVAGLTWRQLNLEAGTVNMLRSKDGIDSTLVLTERMLAMLVRRKASSTSEYVFPTKHRFNNNYKWLGKALERAGITVDAGRVTLHTARHTCASRLLQGGLNLREVQQVLGHKSINSTMVYAHIETSAVAEKAARVLNVAATC